MALKTGITGNAGDYLIKDGANDWFTLVSTTAVGEVADAIVDLGVVQAQAPFDTTGIADGIGTVAAFAFQSVIYAFVAAGLNPEEKVTFQVLVDDTPGPAIVGFGAVTATDPVGRYVKLSGQTKAAISTANAVGIIRLGAAN